MKCLKMYQKSCQVWNVSRGLNGSQKSWRVSKVSTGPKSLNGSQKSQRVSKVSTGLKSLDMSQKPKRVLKVLLSMKFLKRSQTSQQISKVSTGLKRLDSYSKVLSGAQKSGLKTNLLLLVRVSTYWESLESYQNIDILGSLGLRLGLGIVLVLSWYFVGLVLVLSWSWFQFRSRNVLTIEKMLRPRKPHFNCLY